MIHHTLRDFLTSKIPKSKRQFIPSSYDLIGTIALIEIKKELKKYEKAIADALMKVHKHVTTVAKKASPMSGKYRVRKIKIIAGMRNTETRYKENGCIMKLDVAKVYFSVRLSHERERIAALVKKKENVLVLFAGVGPFALVIAKKHPDAQVSGIELNSVAYRYFEENITLNKLSNCTAIKGDVKKTVPKKFRNWADRICMPLPHSAENFLAEAFVAARNGCIVHFYTFIENGNSDVPLKKIHMAAKKSAVRCEVLGWRIVRPYAPSISQIVVDFKIRKNRKALNI